MYVQQAPVPVQESFESPEIVASKIIQLKDWGRAFIIENNIKRVNKALKLFVFIFLFNKSNVLFPE